MGAHLCLTCHQFGNGGFRLEFHDYECGEYTRARNRESISDRVAALSAGGGTSGMAQCETSRNAVAALCRTFAVLLRRIGLTGSKAAEIRRYEPVDGAYRGI